MIIKYNDSKMIFAVDFDGTIVEHRFPEIGEERPGAIQTLKDLQSKGHAIIIWTCREGKSIDEMNAWLDKQGFKPDKINENLEKIDFAYHKIYADYYFDDRSFPEFPGWEKVRSRFLG